MTYSIMSELLQFMYQGQVNVKQSELQAFMTIAETLQIKGLATSSNNQQNHNTDNNNSQQTQRTPDSVNSTNYNQFNQNNNNNNMNNGRTQNQNHHYNSNVGNQLENHRQTTSTPLSSNSSIDNHSMKGKRRLMTWKIFAKVFFSFSIF